MTDVFKTEFGSLIDTGGSGEAVIFLHGFPDTPHLWLPVIERMHGRYRCIAPTLPGFGDHQPAEGPDYSLAGRTRFVQAVLDHMKLDRPVNLVAHDHGGPFGMQWAIEHPDKVRHVAMLGALWPPGYRWHYLARLWRTPLLGEVVMGGFNFAPGKWLGELEMRRGSGGLSSKQSREALARLNPAFLRNALALYRATDARTFDAAWIERWNQLAQCMPVITIWGAHDPYLPARYAHTLGARRVEILENCGHWIQAEAPNRVAQHLLEFFG